MPPLAAVVLAAGKGKRMESDLPKVLHQMAGLPIVEHVLGTLEALTPERTIVFIGHQADRVRQALAARKVTFVEQTEQLGTGHAVSLTRPELKGFSGIVLVLVGDAPLLRPGTVRAMCEQHTREQAACIAKGIHAHALEALGRARTHQHPSPRPLHPQRRPCRP